MTAAALAMDAYVHFDLASTYDTVADVISQGTLFRVTAVLAVVAGLLVLLVNRVWAPAFALLVAAGALVPVLLYRYVDVGELGPIPNMYEPVWYPDKTLTAVAEVVAVAGAAALLVLAKRRSGRAA
ncbi:hypothetical protein CF166_12895 [Amycolatopsis sp. KNN50.9b]|nr:hypothetical protein CF166_12895 [Amycolatopsis sp. KNN50.9b]